MALAILPSFKDAYKAMTDAGAKSIMEAEDEHIKMLLNAHAESVAEKTASAYGVGMTPTPADTIVDAAQKAFTSLYKVTMMAIAEGVRKDIEHGKLTSFTGVTDHIGCVVSAHPFYKEKKFHYWVLMVSKNHDAINDTGGYESLCIYLKEAVYDAMRQDIIDYVSSLKNIEFQIEDAKKALNKQVPLPLAESVSAPKEEAKFYALWDSSTSGWYEKDLTGNVKYYTSYSSAVTVLKLVHGDSAPFLCVEQFIPPPLVHTGLWAVWMTNKKQWDHLLDTKAVLTYPSKEAAEKYIHKWGSKGTCEALPYTPPTQVELKKEEPAQLWAIWMNDEGKWDYIPGSGKVVTYTCKEDAEKYLAKYNTAAIDAEVKPYTPDLAPKTKEQEQWALWSTKLGQWNGMTGNPVNQFKVSIYPSKAAAEKMLFHPHHWVAVKYSDHKGPWALWMNEKYNTWDSIHNKPILYETKEKAQEYLDSLHTNTKKICQVLPYHKPEQVWWAVWVKDSKYWEYKGDGAEPVLYPSKEAALAYISKKTLKHVAEHCAVLPYSKEGKIRYGLWWKGDPKASDMDEMTAGWVNLSGSSKWSYDIAAVASKHKELSAMFPNTHQYMWEIKEFTDESSVTDEPEFAQKKGLQSKGSTLQAQIAQKLITTVFPELNVPAAQKVDAFEAAALKDVDWKEEGW